MKKFSFIVALLGAYLMASAPLYAIENTDVLQVQSAYIYNFTKFIKWPETAFTGKDSPLIIGVIANDAFKGKLDDLNTKKSGTRKLETRYFSKSDSNKACHLLFIADSEKNDVEKILATFQKKPVVTISAIENFSRLGGVIQFVPIRGRLRFIINLSSSREKHVEIDSRLLTLAIEVIDTKR